ncbi:tail fiber assembly protein [Pseudomonas oryzihabitans]|uniref:tail fiber assembly protein n=1 Tax=Pseudomonas oryzihabitans TaxID=47885 RepID=UPI000EDC4715|nr:tail fiber assembly protein [Pseudomonas oryzihabitans]HCV76301.1 phage tail protein [Pseudomonas sp.]
MTDTAPENLQVGLDLPAHATALPWWQDRLPPQVATFDPVSGELLGKTSADPSPLEPDVWLIPAHSTLDNPPEPGAGLALVRRDGAWVEIEDHRGATVYHTGTGEPRQWTLLGPLPSDYTLVAPLTEFDTWRDDHWQLDEAAQLAAAKAQATRKRALLLQYASNQVNALQDAVDLEIATEAEIKALKTWKTYRVLLNRVDTSGAVPAESNWPASPDPAATTGYLSAQGYQEPTPAA